MLEFWSGGTWNCNIMNKNDKKNIIIFIILTFSSSWLIWFISGILLRQEYFIYDSQWLFAQIGVFAPSIIACILLWVNSNENRFNLYRLIFLFLLIVATGFIIKNNNPTSISEFTFNSSIAIFLVTTITIVIIIWNKYFYLLTNKTQNKIEVKWILGSLFFLPAVFLIGWLIVNIKGNGLQVLALQDSFIKSIQFIFIVFSMNLLLGGSMGEEVGWRGYLLPILLKKYTPVGASIILGLIWATWHLPIDLASNIGFTPFIFVFRIIWTLPLAIIFTWYFIKTNGSLLIALFLHTSVNILPDLGFANYESSIMIMTLLLIIASTIIGLQPVMRVELKILR
jgi:membrane protease YdiL (CAAX protease family)